MHLKILHKSTVSESRDPEVYLCVCECRMFTCSTAKYELLTCEKTLAALLGAGSQLGGFSGRVNSVLIYSPTPSRHL